MAIEKFQFLSNTGIRPFGFTFLSKADIRINERIVTVIDANSSDNKMPSAKAIYDAITSKENSSGAILIRINEHEALLITQGEQLDTLENEQIAHDGRLDNINTDITNLDALIKALNHLTIEIVTGAIENVVTPKDDVLYFQRDDENDDTWMLYIHTVNGWVNVGDTGVNLTDYWNKNTEIDTLKESLGMHNVSVINDDYIVSEIDAAFEELDFN